ncbi:MAG: rhomboid family intramembrane serine protease [Bacteroidales bacterium]|jgi:membrane associated rhomboid family serine protease|nr:rhomboid family intramembrane serine protease [Bacteroidales bacterium]
MNLFFSLYKIPFFFIIVAILTQSIEAIFSVSFAHFGIKPLDFNGFLGIFLFPLIHGSWEHLFSNMTTLIILCGILFYHFHSVSHIIFWTSYLIPGLITWIIGRDSFHIGASGITYSLMAFLIFIGFFAKKRNILAISFAMLFLHSGFIWGMIPQSTGISWETHVAGFFVGLALAYFFKDFSFSSYQIPKKNLYSPHSTTFDDETSFTYTVKKKSQT